MSDLVPEEAWGAVVEANPIQAVVSASWADVSKWLDTFGSLGRHLT